MKKNSTILIVDDNPTNIDILVGILEGYNKKVAINGAEALQLAFEETPPDLILLDVMMPEMDGYQVCKELRENDKTQNIPVIFLTAKTREEDIVYGFEVGGQDYVTKPFSPSELLARVHTQLQLKQKNDELVEINQTLEDRVKERTHKLKLAKEKAEEADRLKSEFLASMSHEIRTPLNAICGFSNIIAEANKDPDLIQFTNTVQSQTDILLTLINDIIDFAKIESNSLDLSYETFLLDELLTEIFVQFNLQAGDKKELKVIKPVNSIFITTDKRRLTQVLTNLISNANKFTQNGSVTFGANPKGNAEIHFFVKDTGIGIAEEHLDLIFDRFYKIDSFTQGTGLGLSISKNIIELLGGSLHVKSELNKGTAFTFNIPVSNRVKQITEKDKSLPDEILAKKIDILVAEDMESNQLYLKEILKGYNINLSFASNGREAIDIFQQKNDFDLILMDLKMPVLNGMDAAKEIKLINPVIPIIAVTAYAYSEDRKKIEEAGFIGFISKPINKDKLIRKIFASV